MKKSICICFFYVLIASICLAETWHELSPAINRPSAREKKISLDEYINVNEHIQLVSLAQNTDTFIIGEDIQSVTAERTVYPFYMNAYETTYDLWYQVRVLAEKELGYVFENPGQGGSAGRRARAPSETGVFQPVTSISWRDAIVWCNALSELEGRTPSYTYKNEVLRDATNAALIDLADCNWEADGYRLPTEAEWEYAARKIAGQTGPQSFMGGATVSGPSWNFEAVSAIAEENALRPITKNPDFLQPGTANVATANSLLGPYSAPKSGQANSSGLYDMAGNVLEFCWDWFAQYESEERGQRATGAQYGSERVNRGGSWSLYADFLYSADRYAYDPSENYNYIGFRISTNTP